MSAVGRPVPHESARHHVTGEALYTDDLSGRFVGALRAFPVQSPHAHARVVSLDPAPALAVPGVACVLTADDVPGENDTGVVRHDEPLFPATVMHHGQAAAWVLGETDESARLGAAAVAVEYAPLDAIVGIAEALEKRSFHTEPLRIRRGDPKAALKHAPHRVEGELWTGAQEHFYLETHAAIAHFDEHGQLFVHASTQHPAETQTICARVLGVARARATCQSLRMGGAFGGKETQANVFAAIAAVGAHKTGRPVCVRLDRLRDFELTGKRHPFFAGYEAGFDDEGLLRALDVRLFSDGGWSLDLSEPILLRAMFHLDNAYFIPNIFVEGRACRTNVASHTAFRGFGGPQGMLVIEEVLDRVARALGLSPHVVRERNLYCEGQAAHYGETIRDAERLRQIWTDLSGEARLEARRGEIDAFNREHVHEKRGLALTPVKFGISFTTAFLNQAGALVLIYPDGSVQVNHGGTEMGQGLHTKMLQVTADGLGVRLSDVRIMPTRTDKVPNTSATAASSGSDLNGAAIQAACAELRARLSDVAASMLGASPDTVVFEEGQVHAGSVRDGVSFAQVAARAYLDRVQLFSAGYYRTPDIHYDPAKGTGKPFHYYAFGAAATEVEVDGFTGQYRVRRVDILHDCGDSISPMIDRGQVEGGFVQGMGWLTGEEVRWDGAGRLLTRGASTYKVPGIGDVPEELHVKLLPKAADPSVVHGSKAVGEPPFMLALSVREALRDAVAAFRPGAERVDLACPATPEAVYWAIERLRA